MGGHQERNKRAGTENVAGIVGIGTAVNLIYNEFDSYNNKLKYLRDYYITQIEKNIPNILDAAIYKIFVSSMEIYAKCPVWGRSYKTLKERLWGYIKQYRFSVIKNNRSAIKYRVLALISLLGGKAVQCTYRFLARR